MNTERCIDRFDKYMIYSGLNDNQVTKDAELSVGTIGKSRQENRDLSNRVLNKLLHVYPELSRVWLLTGEGSMIVGNNQESAGVNVTGTGNHVSHNHVGGTDRTPPSGYYDALKESQRQTTQLIQSLQTAQELQTNTQAQLDKLLARLADSQAQNARLIQLLSDKKDK